MHQACFRFYEELNDYLPAHRRKVEFMHKFRKPGFIKDVIESFGVPHAEVDLILVNGESVDFSYPVQNGDRISVYPVFESLDISPLVRLRPEPLRKTRFLADAQLEPLARYLRMLGFDTLYRNDCTPEERVELSREQRRILLTRSRRLLENHGITHGYRVQASVPLMQAREVVERFDLFRNAAPLICCLGCGGMITEEDKNSVLHCPSGRSRKSYDAFYLCPSCRKRYSLRED
ncbi:MAG: Mut7-C RNAse domain-containing protein [Planctomycetota bacterium]